MKGQDMSLLLFICFLWADKVRSFAASALYRLLQISPQSADYLIDAVGVVLFVGCVRSFSKVKGRDIFLYIFLAMLYLASFAFFPDRGEVLTDHLYFFLTGMLFYFVGLVTEPSKVFKAINDVSVLNLLMAAYFIFFYAQSASYQGEVDVESYNMYEAYKVLPSAAMVIAYSVLHLDRKSIASVSGVFQLAVSLVAVLLIISYGTRGPLVCLFFCLLLCLLYRQGKTGITRGKAIMLAAFVILVIFIRPILSLMSDITVALGVSNRIFLSILDIDELYIEDFSNGREEIWGTLMQVMRTDDLRNLFGHGFCASWEYVGMYPHNLVVDLLFTFGYVFGGLVLVGLAALLYKTYRNITDRETLFFFFVLLTCGVVKLLLSSTFIQESMIYWLIGFCVSVNRQSL